MKNIKFMVIIGYFMSFIVLPDVVFCVPDQGTVNVELSLAGQCSNHSRNHKATQYPNHKVDIQLKSLDFILSPRFSSKPLLPQLMHLEANPVQDTPINEILKGLWESKVFEEYGQSSPHELLAFTKMLL